MKVLLVVTKNNYPNPAPDVNTYGQAMPYIAGALKAAGHEVFGVDVNSLWCHGGAPLFLEQAIRSAIQDHHPSLIGFGGMASDFLFLRDAIGFVRRIAPEIPVVLGGRAITYDVSFIFNELEPDFGILGEGEIAISALADCLEKGGQFDTVPSLVWRKDGVVVCNPIQYVEDLDELPLPDYSPFRFEDHLSLNSRTNDFLAHTQIFPRIMPVSMGRSCPFKCTFCCHDKQEGVFHARFRTRSINLVMEEIEALFHLYRFNILYVHDEVFAVQKEKAREFAEQLILLKQRLGVEFDWGCYLRVNSIDSDLLELLKRSSCGFIGFGLESASDTVLKSMKKGICQKDIRNAIDMAAKAGIGIHANFIFGDPAETEATVQETIEFYDAHCRDLAVQFFNITPYPGTSLWNYCQENNLLPDQREYYETIAHRRCGINMSSMEDNHLERMTKNVMNNSFSGRNAVVVELKEADFPCDQDAPFEVRRTYYWINAICPYCHQDIEFLYPMKIEPDQFVQPIMHFCPKCHRKVTLDLSEKIDDLELKKDDFQRYYENQPYVQFYPFDGRQMAMQSVSTPRLVERIGRYNVLQYASYFFAVAHSLGPMDLTKLTRSQIRELCRDNRFIVSLSLDEVIQQIPNQ